jgi:ribosome biogenesis protein ERB1
MKNQEKKTSTVQTKTLEKKISEADKLLNKKSTTNTSILTNPDLSSDDSSDEELLLRTGNVPRKWYDEYDHSGYDINANKVIKPPREDQIESFLKKAEQKNWWRNIYDEMNNKTIFISDKDLELIKRIRKNYFANKNAAEDDYFERNIPKQITPISGKLPWKRTFELSRYEEKAINRIRRAIKNGDIKLDQQKENENDQVYDLWQFENTDPNSIVYHPSKGYPAPKREMPDTELSYNPPDNYVAEEANLDIKQYDALRKIPKYAKLIEENYDRCCDLVISSRFVKKKNDMKIEDILPVLPKPEELKPFPTKENVSYKGHNSFANALVCDPSGKFLISGDHGGFVFFWDVLTGKSIKKIDLEDHILTINYNNTLNLVTVCGKERIYFILPPFLEKKIKKEITNLIDSKIKPLIIAKNQEEQNEADDETESGDDNKEKDTNEVKAKKEKKNQNGKNKKIYEWKIPKENSEKAKNGIVFYIKWFDGVIKNSTWHNKGDYFSVLANNAGGKAQIYIHSLSRLVHQKPFSKIKGIINAVCFHPNKPHFIVATNSNIFVYNLQKQVSNFFAI